MKSLKDYGINYNYIPIIAGPTASGKSSLALKLCEEIGSDLFSCDSMQIYKRLDIGTAKATVEEQNRVRHHLIDIAEPSVSFSVNDYLNYAYDEIEKSLNSKVLPVFCGGTGQYVSSLYKGIKYVDEPIDESITEALYKRYENEGIDGIYEELTSIDPAAASNMHKNNTRRVIRAYAVYKSTGKTFTWWNENSKTEGAKFPFKVFVTDMDRAILYERINSRVDVMINDGLLEEVKALYDEGLILNSTAKQAIGYKELFDYFEGIISLDKAIYDIKLRSRHYAKRQLTWYRYLEGAIYLDPSDKSVAINRILEEIR